MRDLIVKERPIVMWSVNLLGGGPMQVLSKELEKLITRDQV